MAKLSKKVTKAHREACALLERGSLNIEERIFVIENWHEGATHNQGWAGAFFTPWELARDFRIEAPGSGLRVLDLCAGIGILSYFSCIWGNYDAPAKEIVCVEVNSDYLETGKKLLPEARWIRGDVFDLPEDLGHFDMVISNPPFGKVSRGGSKAPRYKGGEFEYHVMDIASDLADYGVFIIPTGSAGFTMTGSYQTFPSRKLKKFTEQTGIIVEPNCGIDANMYQEKWRNAAPSTEVVVCDLKAARERRGQVSKTIPMPQAKPLSLLDWAA